jgi:hypothetical protein
MRAIAGALMLLLAVAAAAVLTAPIHDEIKAQRGLLADQVAVSRAMLELQRQQLAISVAIRDTSQRAEARSAQLLTLSRQLLDRSRQATAAAGRTTTTVAELRALARQLLALATRLELLVRDAGRHVASIDRKTP